MREYKKISILLVVLMLASLMTACNSEGKELVDAIIKNQEIRDMESISEMEMKLNLEGLDEESEALMAENISKMNDTKLIIKQKAVSNEDQTLAKAQMDIRAEMTDMSLDGSIWVDSDLTGEEVYMKQIYRLPSIMMESIEGSEGKKYIVLDMDEMNQSMEDMGEEIDPLEMDRTMEIAMKYQEEFMEVYRNYLKSYKLDLDLVSKLETEIVDGEKIEYYQVKFDDRSFKEFLSYTAISVLKDEKILPLFEEYMEEIMEASGEDLEEMEEISLTENLEETIESVKDFFQQLEEINLLGKDGITITYGINEEGYFVSEVADMDFRIDTSQFDDLDLELEEDYELENPELEDEEILDEDLLVDMPRPIIDLNISYNTKITSINEGIEIIMPETTEENSMSYMEVLENMIPEDLEDMGMLLIVEDEFIEFTNEPIKVNDRYLVASRDMAKALGAEIDWTQETREITISKDDKKLIFNARNNDLLVDDNLEKIDVSILIIDGVSYIPLRAVSENLGYTVDWDGDFNIVTVYK